MCAYYLSSSTYRLRHQRNHTGEKICCNFPDCPQGFFRKDHYKTHRATHTVKERSLLAPSVAFPQVQQNSSFIDGANTEFRDAFPELDDYFFQLSRFTQPDSDGSPGELHIEHTQQGCVGEVYNQSQTITFEHCDSAITQSLASSPGSGNEVYPGSLTLQTALLAHQPVVSVPLSHAQETSQVGGYYFKLTQNNL